jgi:hypothetical protein
MGTLSRLRDFTADRDATPPVAISAQGIDDELDQIITETNAQDVRLDTLEAGGNVSTADLEDDAVTPAKTSFVDDTLVATDTHIMVADGTDFDNVAVSGDATLSNTGVLTVGTGVITSAKIANSTISTGDISADAIDGTLIADDAINSEHYTDGSIDLAHMSADSVDGSKIADDSIDSEHYVDGSIDSAHIANDAIDSQHYAAGSIDSEHLSPDCVVSAKVADNSLVNADINTSAAIDATKIHNGSVTNTEFGYLGSVTSDIQTQINNVSAGAISNVQDNVFRICDDLDNTKDIAFQSSAITSGNVRTITMADQDIDLAPTTGTYATECFKSITDGSNIVAADSVRDTLTITGTGATTVTNTPGTDTITINSTAGASVGLVLALG